MGQSEHAGTMLPTVSDAVLIYLFIRASVSPQRVKNPPVMQECRRHRFGPWVWKIPLEEEMATHPPYSFLGNPMDRGAWQATV